ncbi:hypothetical protein vseg_015099 [Gypsophila vaccaria]
MSRKLKYGFVDVKIPKNYLKIKWSFVDPKIPKSKEHLKISKPHTQEDDIESRYGRQGKEGDANSSGIEQVANNFKQLKSLDDVFYHPFVCFPGVL